MINDWYRTIRLPITFEQFGQLPRHPAYKYEYFDDRAVLSPRPWSARAILDLKAVPEAVTSLADVEVPFHKRSFHIRPLRDADWALFPPLFSAAFLRMPPFSTLDDDTRLTAAKDCLDYARTGGDGPLIGPACFVAADSDSHRNPEPDVPVADIVDPDDQSSFGAILITLVPKVDLAAWNSLKWKSPPPADALDRCLGRPHLTWIFVNPWMTFEGVGTALLAESITALRRLGYQELSSSFLLGNDTSLCWHWRCGFRLLPHMLSRRRHYG